VLARTIAFSPAGDESFFRELPAEAAVFLLRGGGEPYVSKTANLRRRLQRLLGPPTEASKRLNLRHRVAEIEFTCTGSEFESQFLLYRVLREIFPKTYSSRLRIRPAPLVKLHLENEYPRASVTTRMGRPSSRNLYYGPFPARAAAEKFAGEALDFFKMRRCVEDLHPDPAFPGCIYSEMKMCLAPCFQGCTDAEYQAEVARVRDFLDSRGESLARTFHQQREHASSDLAFEEAAAIHARIEKLTPLISHLPEIVRPIERLRAVIIQPGAMEAKSGSEGHSAMVSLFLFHACALEGPFCFDVQPNSEAKSMESRVQEALANIPEPQIRSSNERMEHLAILKRWYYRSYRSGEIFFADDKQAWPLRRIVRGIARVYRGEKHDELATVSATPIAPQTSDST
jgi:excinuclease ABC subunit C